VAAACLGVRHASKKAGGSSCNGRDSESKRLGLKKFGGEAVIPGNIIIRQRGKTYHPGSDVGMGKDHTIFAMQTGHVRFDWNTDRKRFFVSVESPERWQQRQQDDMAAAVVRREKKAQWALRMAEEEAARQERAPRLALLQQQ
jgi:large subunit ribosomal protein L27